MISVLMSIFNERIDWLKSAVDSILLQSYNDFEFIIVIDNPNLDIERVNYLKGVADSDSRVKLVFNKENVGLASSLNVGLSLATGEFIARMDADDISEIERFNSELTYLVAQGADMVATNRIIIDEDGKEMANGPVIKEDPNKYLPYSTMIVHPSVLIKTNVLKELNGYRNFQRSQDYDLWLRMVTSGKKIVILDEFLIRYRVRKNSLTNQNRLEQFYINKYQKQLYFERVRTGKDSFSEEGLRTYLCKKKIDDKKNKRCIYTMQQLDIAKKYLAEKKIRFVVPIVIAFISFPEIVISVFHNTLRKALV